VLADGFEGEIVRRKKAGLALMGAGLGVGVGGAQEAAKSHTGAIAGDYAAFEAMCERFGIVACRNMDDMVETALAFHTTRRPKGPRIGLG